MYDINHIYQYVDSFNIIKIEDVKIGMWASQSCHLDLHQIKTNDEIKMIKDAWEDSIDYDVYYTKRAALIDIRQGFRDQKSLDEIDILLIRLQVDLTIKDKTIHSIKFYIIIDINFN